MDKPTKILNYRKYIFMYGIISIILVLEFFEQQEDFEECQIIVKAIREQEEIIGAKLYTRITEDCIKDVTKSYKKYNMTGENALENSKFYATKIIKELVINE